MLKITKEDIQSLNDADLRNLIGMLCEATLYTIQNRTTDVMYGGNQDEKDDGIDVYVKASKIADGECPILRNNTIFQVKKPKMPMNKIKAEMTDKNGNIKKCISDLEKSKGAYIIVSSGDDLTQKTYTSRKDTMQTIIDEARLKNVVVDFYDCGRIATWVGDYPSIVCWVLNHVGKNVNGWTSYCNWSSRNTTEKEYLIDENSVIYKDNFSKDNKLNLVDGINEIRKKLLWERTSVRLAGLSGVGKTRFAQALFDEKIGINPLNKEEVIYGDIGDSLQPEPIAFIQQLQTLNKRIILVVDNCEPNMHNKLTEICQREKSLISLLTIEYDVKEDDNIDSNNYYLSPTSDELLKKMLKRDFENISDINISTIANCSDGNFRIAIYLARSIANEKNIGVLKSNEIFERIFYQGGCIDSDLLAVGEVCSLFYSFNTMPELGNVSNELNIISSLIDVKPLKVFEKVEELAQRQIIQRRGDRMCAVLPHALANKLSMDFLKKYPSETILDVINKNQRLTISFFRRLKFLHLSKEAQDIGKKFIDEISNNEIYSASRGLIEKIRCVSIINPGLILEKIENIEDNKFFSRENKNLSEWIMILCTIAYDRKLFKRAINIMIKFILPEKENESYNSNKDILKAFFHIYGSGTYATIDDKIEIIDDLLMESDVKKNEVGLILLEELMATGTFICFPITDCGSQIRGYGLEPNPTEWYNKVISYCDGLLKNEKLYNKIKNILISHFKDLASVGFYYELEKVVLDNLSKGRWSKLWISLLVIKHFDSEKIPEEMMKRIDNLINIVRPKTIKEKIETFLCNSNKIYYELDDTTDDYDSVDTIIYELGCEIGRQSKHMKEYIGMLNNNSNIYRIGKLAEGIYCKCQEKEKLILDTLDLYDASNCNVIRTIVNTYVDSYHTEDYEKCSQLINRIAEDENYKKYYTFIQLSYQIDEIDCICQVKIEPYYN